VNDYGQGIQDKQIGIAEGVPVNKKAIAFGAPGIEPRWTSSAKTGIGTAYHTSSRVWFTISHGIVNENAFSG
jgi:hypothetical protein